MYWFMMVFTIILNVIFVPFATSVDSDCNCGYRMEKKIVGGYEPGVHEYSSMAALVRAKDTSKVVCGASIIAPRYALTAANCFQNLDNSEYEDDSVLKVGGHNLGQDTIDTVIYLVDSITIHPEYTKNNPQNNIAILETEIDIKFGKSAGPVCLPFNYQEKEFAGDTVTALGWDNFKKFGTTSIMLQAVELKVIPNEKCAKELSDYKEDIIQDQICTYSKGKDTCQHDNGGPLLWQDPNTKRLQLVGIILQGIADCGKDVPRINTRVTSYVNWIKSTTPNAVYCEA